MRTEKEIKEQIEKVTQGYSHVLDCPLAVIDINAPRALMQIEAKTTLTALYWIIGKKRPKFNCDD